MKRGSAPATHRQKEFSSGRVCHFHSHLACLSFAPALNRSKSLPAFCVSQRTMLLSAAYQEILLRNYLPSKGKSLTDYVSENGRIVYSVLCQSGEGDPAAKIFLLMVTAQKRQVKTRDRAQIHQTSQQLLLPYCWVWGYKDQQHSTRTGVVAWPLYCPRRKYSFKSRLSYQWSMCCWSKFCLLSFSLQRQNQDSRSLCKLP